MGEGSSAPPQPCKHGAGRWGLRSPGEWHSGHRTTKLNYSPLPWGKPFPWMQEPARGSMAGGSFV